MYKFPSLFINQPITLIGQPETILEVDGGSIIIDFGSKNAAGGLGGAAADDEVGMAATGSNAVLPPASAAEDDANVLPATPFAA